MLAQASEAVCIGFNIGPDANAKRVAEQVGVRTRRFDIIYEVADEVKKMMGGLLAPEIVETALGKGAEKRLAGRGGVFGRLLSGGTVRPGDAVRVVDDAELADFAPSVVHVDTANRIVPEHVAKLAAPGGGPHGAPVRASSRVHARFAQKASA